MKRTYDDEARLQAVLRAADSDLSTLLEATVAVIEERHPDQENAQREAEDFTERLRAACARGPWK